MIDHVDRDLLDQMAERSDGPWISMYVPTEKAGPNRAAKIHYKNLVTEAFNQLSARDVSHPSVEALRARTSSVLDDAPLWASADRGLAVFVAPDDQLVVRLAYECEPSVVVADQPNVDGVRVQVDDLGAYAVLAVSLKHVRLLRGSSTGLTEDTGAGLPTDLESALALDDRESQLQSHASGRVGAGRTTAAFHGHDNVRDADIGRFMRLVDDALTKAVPADVPIVLAGVDRTVTAFRQVARHPGLVDQSISGNADRSSPAELADKARAILRS